MKKLIVLLAFSAYVKFAFAHKFYMSLTEMQFNSQTNSLEVIVKLFTDDIEQAVEKSIDYRLFLGTEREHQSTDSLIKAYFFNHFKVEAKGMKLKLDFLGKEAERDYTWLYIEIADFDPNRKYQLTNTILIELFDEQSNKVNYYCNGETKSLSLHKDKTQGSF